MTLFKSHVSIFGTVRQGKARERPLKAFFVPLFLFLSHTLPSVFLTLVYPVLLLFLHAQPRLSHFSFSSLAKYFMSRGKMDREKAIS
jgi:hypothetical protein